MFLTAFLLVFKCCPLLEYLSVKFSEGSEIQCDEAFVPKNSTQQTAKNLKFLSLLSSESEHAVNSICNLCPELEELHLNKPPRLPIESNKLSILALNQIPQTMDSDWFDEFSHVTCFKWHGCGNLDSLDFLKSSNVTHVEFSMDHVHSSISIPNLTALTISGRISDEGESGKWTTADCINFFRRHRQDIQKLRFGLTCSLPDAVLKFIAEKCKHLELISFPHGNNISNKQVELFCQHRQVHGNCGERLKISTNLTINSDYLNGANALLVNEPDLFQDFGVQSHFLRNGDLEDSLLLY